MDSGTITNQCGIFFNNAGTINDNLIIDQCTMDNNEAVPTPKSKNDDKSSSSIPMPKTDDDFQINERAPEWIKTNAGWWSDGKIEDSEFILGIEFLINENIIVIQNVPTHGINENGVVPDWFRNNASWWALDLITEDDFINAVKFLIEKGVIKVNNF